MLVKYISYIRFKRKSISCLLINISHDVKVCNLCYSIYRWNVLFTDNFTLSKSVCIYPDTNIYQSTNEGLRSYPTPHATGFVLQFKSIDKCCGYQLGPPILSVCEVVSLWAKTELQNA